MNDPIFAAKIIYSPQQRTIGFFLKTLFTMADPEPMLRSFESVMTTTLKKQIDTVQILETEYYELTKARKSILRRLLSLTCSFNPKANIINYVVPPVLYRLDLVDFILTSYPNFVKWSLEELRPNHMELVDKLSKSGRCFVLQLSCDNSVNGKYFPHDLYDEMIVYVATTNHKLRHLVGSKTYIMLPAPMLSMQTIEILKDNFTLFTFPYRWESNLAERNKFIYAKVQRASLMLILIRKHKRSLLNYVVKQIVVKIAKLVFKQRYELEYLRQIHRTLLATDAKYKFKFK